MSSRSFVLLAFLVVVISLIHRKTIDDTNHEFETDSQQANGFLHQDQGVVDVDKREFGIDCVPCKLGINPCCKPNLCKKNRFWFDECMEIKTVESQRHNYH